MLAVPTLAVAQNVVSDAIIHIAAGISITAGAAVPALWAREDVGQVYWISAYSIWGAASLALFMLELLRHPNQRRLLLGLVLFSGLNLLGSLSQGTSTMLDAAVAWGPLALSASLCLMLVLIGSFGAGSTSAEAGGAPNGRGSWYGTSRKGEMAVNLAGVY